MCTLNNSFVRACQKYENFWNDGIGDTHLNRGRFGYL